jgi:hypothetical protein
MMSRLFCDRPDLRGGPAEPLLAAMRAGASFLRCAVGRRSGRCTRLMLASAGALLAGPKTAVSTFP